MQASLALPILQEPVQEATSSCLGIALCPSCPLNKENRGPCRGCTPQYHKGCRQDFCHSNCNVCGGGRHTSVVAACGRSTLRNKWAKLFRISIFPYTPPPVNILSTIIPVILPQVASFKVPEAFPDLDAWAVPIHKCMNLKGEFRSKDLKDYLGLPKNRKLLLSTSGPDTFMEMLWEKGERLDFKGHSIDYWFPAHFSIYDNDSKFYQFFNAKRQQLHAARIRSQFVWFRLGECIPVSFLEPISKAHSVLISTQQMYASRNRVILQRECRIADHLFPVTTQFFIVGTRRLVDIQPRRRVHEINQRWILMALNGRSLQNKVLRKQSKSEILRANLKEVCNGVRI
jgi:hypothetical protein